MTHLQLTQRRPYLAWSHAGLHHLLLAGLLLLSLQGCHGNLCEEYSETALEDALFDGVVPAGGSKAGNYSKVEVTDLSHCIVSCCKTPNCDVVFFHENCFHIHCDPHDLEACQPRKKDSRKFENAYMVLVKIPVSGSENNLPDSDYYSSPSDKVPSSVNTGECDPHRAYDCGNHGECNLLVTEDVFGYFCECDMGYIYDQESQICRWPPPELPEIRPHDTSCTYGIFECLEHEKCQLRNSRSKSGSCVCTTGYVRDPDTRYCVPEIDDPDDDGATNAETADGGLLDDPPGSAEKKSGSSPTDGDVPETSSTVSSTSMVPTTTTRANPEVQDEVTSPTKSSTEPSGNNSVTLPTKPPTTTPEAKTPSTSPLVTPSTTSSVTPSATSSVTTSSTTTSVKEPFIEPLVVSAGQEKTIQLPVNSATLVAYVVPKDDQGTYRYVWSLISHPDSEHPGEMTDINTESLKLTNLIVGLYVFKVAVSAEGKYGEAFVNVTVLPPARDNAPPVAVVKPLDQTVNQPNDVILDGSDSTDDDKITAYQWEKVTGPMNSQPLDSAKLTQPNIVLHGLAPGKYRFKLTVTDSDGVTNSTFANVTYIKETDYPPMANAGSNIITSLPQNTVTLYGNASTDDHGIASYEWIKQSDDKLTADMTGTRTPILHLEHLEVGDYTFTLKVTDTAGQVSTADVHVFVKPEVNKPPVASAGEDKEVLLPIDTTTLDGSHSTDDKAITSYAWSQVNGPTGVTIENNDRAVATASHLTKGEFRFRLTVTDEEGVTSVDDVTITAKQNENHPPVANAGGDQIVTLPVTLVTMDGSKSTDDKEITSYEWVRDDKSLAAGDILNNSDHSAILQLTNVVSGRYIFSLKVTDGEGMSSTDKTSVIVKPNPHMNDMVEMQLASNLGTFMEANRRNLVKQLSLLVHSTQREGDTEVTLQKISETGGNLAVVFYATNTVGDKTEVLPGSTVVTSLKKKLALDTEVLDFKVVELDTVICQKNCSGHGHCDSTTKLCICEAFWMQNMFKYYLGDGESNCDWSVLYVIIIAFVILVATGGIIWGLVCLCKSVLMTRWQKFRPRKRHRYTLLEEMDSKGKAELLPRGEQTSSLMVSESDFSSDEETIFVNNKKSNGHIKNGLTPHNKNKIKT